MSRSELVFGELVGGPASNSRRWPVPGVTAWQAQRGSGRITIQERLYECANRWALGA
jgi:hypothetical protein